MKRFLLILLTFWFINGLHAQESADGHKWSAELFFSPDYSYRLLTVKGEGFEWFKTSRDKIEIGKISYHAGYNMRYGVNEKISLAIGLSFYDIGWKTENIPVGDGVLDVSVIDKYRLASLLADVAYNLTDPKKKVHFFMACGFSLNGIVDSRSFYVYSDGDNAQNIDVLTGELDTRKFLLGVNFGFGLKYNLNERIVIIYQPGASLWLTSTVDSEVGEYIYSINNKIGVGIDF